MLQEIFEVGDPFDDLLVLLHNFVALEPGEAAQPHVHDRFRLPLGKLEPFLEPLLGGLLVLGFTDRLDDGIEVVERDLQAFEQMGTIASPLELVAGAPGQDLAAVVDVVLEEGLEVEDDRAAVDQRQRNHAEGRLQGGVLVQIVEHGQGSGVLLELDDDPHTMPVGLVVEVGDALELSFADELGDAGDQGGLVDHVGDLGDDDAFTAVLGLFEGMTGANDQPAVASAIGRRDPLPADDDAAGRKVRATHQLHQVLGGGVRMVDDCLWQLGTGEADGEPVECFSVRGGVLSELGRRRLDAFQRVFVLHGPSVQPESPMI